MILTVLFGGGWLRTFVQPLLFCGFLRVQLQKARLPHFRWFGKRAPFEMLVGREPRSWGIQLCL